MLFIFGPCLLAWVAHIAAQSEEPKPNFVLILADDQDWMLDGMTPMHQVQQWLGTSGAVFKNAFTSSPICCPSRASLLSGMYAHNHGTTNNSLSGGCYGARWRSKIEPLAWPAVLQKDGGYSTFYAGKYLNQYKGDRVPRGWNAFHGLHGNSRYYNYTLRENGQNISYADVYLTDLLRNKTLAFLDAHAQANEKSPFFAMIATPAPHAPFTPAERHRNRFANVTAPRTPNFNYTKAGILDKHWLIQSAQPLTADLVNKIDEFFRLRWESLLAVDELVDAIMKRLEALKMLDNTYIIYTSDNGYHLGQFAQPWDKRQPYETDTHIPLYIRGPRVPAGIEVVTPTLLLDLPPTILQWAGLKARTLMDGLPLQPHLNADTKTTKGPHRSLLIEYWGEGNDQTYNAECPYSRKDNLAECTLEAECHCQDSRNNTYACVRHFRDDVNRLYCEFQDKAHLVEAYDFSEDAFQLTNMGYEWLPIERALYNLALANLTRCAGATCNDVTI